MKPTQIIIHHSLTKDNHTVSWGAIRRYHVNELKWRDIGYHFGVEQVGLEHEIFVGRMLTEQGAHTLGQNDSSIGICFLGNFDILPPKQDQWDLGVRLVRSLCEVFNISKDKVLPHNHYANKSCPGKYFDMAKFVGEL